MRIAYNPKSAEPLKVAPSGDYQNAITFDLAAHNIYARGELFKGTDTTYEVFKKHTTSNNGGSNGLVPVPSYTTTAIRFLREDGTWVVPNNSITHLYVGAKSSNNNNNSNSATSNNNTYIKLFDDTTLRHQYQIKGTGLVTVSSDASGNITINSAANNYYRPISVNGTAILENDNKALNLVQYGAVVLTPNTDTNGDYTGDVQISISEATQSSSGLLSAVDKQKLDGLTFGGGTGNGGFSGVLADAFTTITFGGNSIVAAAGKQTFTFKNGSGISLNLNPTDYSLTIAGNTMTGASSTKAGTLGFVPAPAIGKQTAYLRGDGTWNILSTDQIYTLNGYTIGTSVENLATSDTLNGALGKLEYKANKGVEAYNIISAAYDGDGTIENLNEILKVLEGISDTDTISAIIGKYLPLTGGTITGNLTVNGTTTLSTTNINNTLTVKGNIVPQATNTYTLGTTSKIWKNIYSGLGTFSDNVTAKGFIKTGSSNSYVLLGGGGHKALSDFMLKSEILTNNLTTISKSLTVTQAWMDTGIKYTDLPATGTYIVQVYVHNTADSIWYNYWSGIMSWYRDGTNDSKSDEILLHRAGHAYGHTIYLRTIMTANSDGRHLRLQIAADKNLTTAATYTFKFKRII